MAKTPLHDQIGKMRAIGVKEKDQPPVHHFHGTITAIEQHPTKEGHVNVTVHEPPTAAQEADADEHPSYPPGSGPKGDSHHLTMPAEDCDYDVGDHVAVEHRMTAYTGGKKG